MGDSGVYLFSRRVPFVQDEKGGHQAMVARDAPEVARGGRRVAETIVVQFCEPSGVNVLSKNDINGVGPSGFRVFCDVQPEGLEVIVVSHTTFGVTVDHQDGDGCFSDKATAHALVDVVRHGWGEGRESTLGAHSFRH